MKGIDEIIASLAACNYQYTLINLRCGGVTNKQVLHLISTLLKYPNPVRSLDLSSNELSDTVAKPLRGLKLQELKLDYNLITCKGAKSLAKGTYAYLSLRNNKIKDEGAKHFSKSKTLRFLDLSKNLIKNPGARAFSKNSNLVYLNLTGNVVSETSLAFVIRKASGILTFEVDPFIDHTKEENFNNSLKSHLSLWLKFLDLALTDSPSLPQVLLVIISEYCFVSTNESDLTYKHEYELEEKLPRLPSLLSIKAAFNSTINSKGVPDSPETTPSDTYSP